ncbi:hypothetical protein NDU88_007952 [Pleurodeles waltl]|uniref:Uncharacterized protein n=1 Tax=Pleurodeles waltl TaxID=8319 RepID=A0AAV7U325_PLEWA|nr:hypothetical protein NDU88_007952 [Pleurodeles waltl]
MEGEKELDHNLQRPGRKRQWQRKEDFYTTKKKHIISQAEEQTYGYTTHEDDIEDTGGTPGEQNLAIQTPLKELHQQLALIDVTEIPEAGAEIQIPENDESKRKEDQQVAQHPQQASSGPPTPVAVLPHPDIDG